MLELDLHYALWGKKIVFFAERPFDADSQDCIEFFFCPSDQSPPGFTRFPTSTSLIDLTQDETVLWDNIQRKTRQKIKRAINHGIKVAFNQQYEEFYILYSEFRQKKGFGSFIFEIPPIELTKKHGILVTETLDDLLLGGSLLLYDDTHVICWVMGSRRLNIDQEMKKVIGDATSYGTWEGMKYAKQQGKQLWDWGGLWLPSEIIRDPSREGINRFKLNFGGTQEKRYNYQKIYSRKYRYSKYLASLFGGCNSEMRSSSKSVDTSGKE